MLRSLFISLFVFSSFLATSQSNELVYKKLLESYIAQTKPYSDGSGYVSLSLFSPNSASSVDVGLWSEFVVDCLINDTLYKDGMAIYNADFTPVDAINFKAFINGGFASYGFRMQFFPVTNPKTILHFDWSTLWPAPVGVHGIYTPLGNFVPEISLQCLFIAVDPIEESAEELLSFSYDNTSNQNELEPYNGYFVASYDRRTLTAGSTQVAAILGDSIFIAYLNLYDQQSIRTPFETVAYNTWNEKVNIVRVAMNLHTRELINSQQIGSSHGNLGNFILEPTKDMSGVYRAGLVRGNNTPVSASGSELEMPPNDSLFHVFITKEDASGQTQWLTELYAYNNALSDTIPPGSNLFIFKMRNQFHSILEKDNEVFVTTSVMGLGQNTDSLLYRNFLGQDNFYSEYIPIVYSNPDDQQILFSQRGVYKLNTNGNIVGELSHTDNLNGRSNAIGSAIRGDDLFEISDKLAWVNSYYTLNDSVGKFTYKTEGEGEYITYINLPAGTGEYILWLDTDLNIVDHWIIPYQQSYTYYSKGINIKSVLAYTGDTLIIQGNIRNDITTSLDPFGVAPEFTSGTGGTFFAAYAAPEIFTSTSEKNGNKIQFKIFPNPTNGVLHISGINAQNSFYTVLDISGRAVINGRLNTDQQINTEGLKTGMYILSIESEQGVIAEKFVVG